jgi:hypothetical protein
MKVGSLSSFCEHGHDFLVTQKAQLLLGCLTRKDLALRFKLISCKVTEHAAVLSYQYLKQMQGCTRVEAASCRPFTTEVRDRFQASRFCVCGEQSGPKRGFTCSHIADAV